jgi:hypothetical protein
MAESIVTLSADEAALLKAFQRIQTGQAKQDEGYAKNEKSSKKAADQAIKDAERVERESKRAGEAVFREHQKLLDQKDLESRKAAQKQEALARETAFAEVKAALKAAEQEIAATEKILRAKAKAAEKEAADAEKAADNEANASSKRLQGLAAAAASYVSLNTVAALYKQNLQEQIALQDQSLAKVNEIAVAQSGAVKNLAGLSTVEKAEALKAAKTLQAEIGFSDQSKLAEAIGTGYSASGDLGKTMSAVRAAAQLTQLTPDELPTVASGALDASRGTGIADANANLSFLLKVGALARVEDPAQLARTLAPSLSSGVATVPTQNKQEASKEIASIFSELNQFATDTQGDSTRTATVTLLAKLEEFFRDTSEEALKIQDKIAPLERKLNAPAKRGKKAGLLPEEQRELDALRTELASISNLQDSGTVLGRIDQIRQDPELKKKFFENDFGEAAFKGGFRQLFEDGPLLQKVRENTSVLDFDTKEYFKTVSELETVSPEIREASEAAKDRAKKELQDNNPDASAISRWRDKTREALVRNRRVTLGGAFDAGYQNLSSLIAPANNDIQANGQWFISELQQQINRINDAGGSSPEDMAKKKNLQETIEDIGNQLGRKLAPASTDSRAKELEALDKNNKLLEQNNKVLDLLSQNLGGGNAGGNSANPIREQVARAKDN